MNAISAGILLLACGAGHAAEWFPAEPAPADVQYVIYTDTCGEQPPIGRPTLERYDDDAGSWTLKINHDLGQLCFGTPAPGSARTYAFAMPDRIDDVPVERVVVSLLGNIDDADFNQHFILERPATVAVPAAIGGTWTLDGARHQGLLIAMDEIGRLAISLDTYDAQGRPAWYSGMGFPQGADTRVSLTDTVSGAFLSTPATAPAARAWGDLTVRYLRCGLIDVTWQPRSETNLPPGSARFTQLTGTRGQICDLGVYAAAHNGQPLIVEYDIVR